MANLRFSDDIVMEIEIEDVLVDDKMGSMVVTPFTHKVRLTGQKDMIARQIDGKIAELEVFLKKLRNIQDRGGLERTQIMIDHLERAVDQYRQAKGNLK